MAMSHSLHIDERDQTGSENKKEKNKEMKNL